MKRSTNSLKGVGIGYLPSLHEDFINYHRQFQFTELRSESFFACQFPLEQLLEKIISLLPVTLHGTEMSFASLLSRSPQNSYLNELQKLIKRTGPFLVSDHFSWTKSAHSELDLYFPPFNDRDQLHILAAKWKKISSKLGMPLALENVADMPGVHKNNRSEGEYFRLFCGLTNAPIILNLDSILVTSALSKRDPCRLIAEYPLEYIQSVTIVPRACMNAKMSHLFGQGFDRAMLDLLDFVLQKTSATTVLIQRRYPHNNYKSLAKFISAVHNIFWNRRVS